MKVSVIIVNYNTENDLQNCIASLYEYVKLDAYEIIVVDNNSKTGSLDKLAEIYPNVSIEFLPKNLGFGQANNWGVQNASGEFLLFLNPDTLLINDAISIFYDYMKLNPEVGICGGNLYKGNLQPNSSFYIIDFLCLEYRFLFNRKFVIGFNNTDLPLDVNVIVGADLFIRTNLFKNLNGFDPDFFMYFEEAELCDRAKKAGCRIMSLPAAKIIHLQGGSAENKNETLKKWSYAEHWYSKFIYFTKTKGNLATKLIYALHIAKAQTALIIFKITNNRDKQNYWQTKKQIITEAYKRIHKK